MKRVLSLLVFIGCIQFCYGQNYKKEAPFAHTYSIVAYDSATGDIGVAVQSHWFSVGTVVAWAEAGVGAVATQSFSNPAFGPQGLALMKTGLDAELTLNALIESDEGRDYRQLGVIDANGKAKSYTGAKNIVEAGHITGKYYAVQANMMKENTVWPAMAKAFESTAGTLAERMLAALEAAQAEGGDIRGKQSAALLVVSGKPTGKVWVDRLVDLRVDDSPNPLKELRRLLEVKTAYDFMNAGDLAIEAGDYNAATKAYSSAEKMFPDNLEMQYWHAVNLANQGNLDKALPMFKSIFSENNDWKKLTPRLIKPGILNVSEKDLKRILKQ
ncbi:MAG: DUF1028 domain-containing protein [Bacteroidota bacterium]